MPIVDMQRRLHERGRLRLGEKRPDRNGQQRPAKLQTFRFTSTDRLAIDTAAEAYGGHVEAWEAGPGGAQWQVVTDATELPVIVPVGIPLPMLSQFYELWSGGGCQRRCDGQVEFLGDQQCMCDPDDRQCKPTTRLNLLLPDLAGLGVWRLESHGWYAAAELAGVVAVLERAAERGAFHPARLRAEQREVKRYDKGKPVTHQFVVPVLDVDMPLGSMLPAAASPPDGLHGATGELEPSPNLRPVPSDQPQGPPSVKDQLAGIGTGTRRGKPRSAPPPPTNVTVMPAGGNEDPFQGLSDDGPDAAAAPEGGMAPPASLTDPEVMRRRVMAETGKTWPDMPGVEREELRHALGIVATFNERQALGHPPTQSVNDMTLDERLRLSKFMADIRTGKMLIEATDPDPDGHPTYRCWMAGGSKTAHLTRRAVDDWSVRVEAGVPS
jgi:Recombination directionality factor-like